MTRDITDKMNERISSILALFASTSTLLCCALPSVFVLLGAGATFASLVSVFPFLIDLSRYKMAITLFAAAMILIASIANHRLKSKPCPVDSELREACMQNRKITGFIFYVSVTIFIAATLFTYLIPRII